MQGKTHRIGGVLCALTGYTILESQGMLIPNVDPLIQLAVMYPFAMYGSVVSDLDHHWESTPSKDPVSWVINRVLHLTTGKLKKSSLLSLFDAKHRSWQTHSDILFFIAIGSIIFALNSSLMTTSAIIFRLIILGFMIGLISHLLLDAITPEGIWLIPISVIRRKRVSLSLVPSSKFFATGGPWERLIRSIMWVIIISLIVYIVYKASPFRFSFNF